jgi:4-hydroxy-4-methyl-2-oxoglutarate aldolase
MTGTRELEEVYSELLEFGTATIYEASGLPCFLPAELRPVWRGARVVGTALPVSAEPGDNLPLHLAVESARPGDVLVVDAGGTQHGYWGEVLTVAAQQRGVSGIVIDGGVRDTSRLEGLGFPAFSRWTALAGTAKTAAGTVGTPIRLGDALVERDDVVVADEDGCVVLPRSRLVQILESSRERVRKETDYLRRLRAGELTMDIYGFRRNAGAR